MSEQASKEWVKDLVEGVKKEVAKNTKDLDDAWDSLHRHKEAAKRTAQLAVYTARDSEQQQSRNDLVVYLNGDLKKAVWDALKKYKKDAKGKRDAREAALREGLDGVDGQLATQAASAMQISEDKSWKVIYTEQLLGWCTTKASPREEVRLKAAVQEATGVRAYLAEAVVYQRFHVPEPQEGKAWAATLALDGGTAGRSLYGLLRHGFRNLYLKGADLGVGPAGGNKDRYLTAQVAEYAEVPVRDGKGKGKGEGKGKGKNNNTAVKRQSPEPERGASAASKQRR